MLTKNITTASCMTAPKPGPQGAQATSAPGALKTPPATTTPKASMISNSRFENSFVVKQDKTAQPRGTGPTGAPGGQQGGISDKGNNNGQGQPPQDTNGRQQGGPQGSPNGNPPPQNANPCAGQISALVADLTAFEATLKAKTPASSTPQSPNNGAQGGQQGQKGQQDQPSNGPQVQPTKA